MTIATLCLLRLPTPPAPSTYIVRVEPLEDAVLLHTDFDFASDPEGLSRAIQNALGPALTQQHVDPRGVFLIPSIAAPRARSYAGVLEEVGEGGVWARWGAAAGAQGGLPDLSSLLGGMLGQDPSSAFAAAAASLQADPSLLKAASQQLPGLLQNPAELSEMMSQANQHMPELTDMLRGMGINIGASDLQQMTQSLQAELARDPKALANLAEQLFSGEGAPDADDEDDDAPSGKR
ncbi:MAG: hypothetical protein ABW321_31215 [Polyangiales bacterium]